MTTGRLIFAGMGFEWEIEYAFDADDLGLRGPVSGDIESIDFTRL